MKTVLLALLALNAATFLLFYWDKRSARRGRSRIPEAWLLLGSALGGSAGAWIGSAFFRHKTRKQSFRAKLLVATVLPALLGWLWWRGR